MSGPQSTRPKTRATIYDGESFHEIPAGLGTGDWLRGLPTPALRRLAGGETRSNDVDPNRLQRMVRHVLAERCAIPEYERAIETAAGVGARRRWLPLLPILTNYNANGGS